jgi:hypothetical protein
VNDACTCSRWWLDPDTGDEYDQGGGDRIAMRSSDPDPDCPVHSPRHTHREEAPHGG